MEFGDVAGPPPAPINRYTPQSVQGALRLTVESWAGRGIVMASGWVPLATHEEARI